VERRPGRPRLHWCALTSLGWSYRIPALSAVQTKAICYEGSQQLTTTSGFSYIFTDPSGLRTIRPGEHGDAEPGLRLCLEPATYKRIVRGDDFFGATISGANGFTGGTVTVGEWMARFTTSLLMAGRPVSA